MSRRLLSHAILACALTCGVSSAYAQEHEVKKAGKAAAEAGKDAGKAAEEGAKVVAKGAKKTAKSVKHAVTPDDTTALCKDGTVQKGKTKTTACDDHGGVKKH